MRLAPSLTGGEASRGWLVCMGAFQHFIKWCCHHRHSHRHWQYQFTVLRFMILYCSACFAVYAGCMSHCWPGSLHLINRLMYNYYYRILFKMSSAGSDQKHKQPNFDQFHPLLKPLTPVLLFSIHEHFHVFQCHGYMD
jgi:hypothetical protein